MERLKAILADKILDLSVNNGDEVKATLDKIQRFRDFANACQTLMKKYPAIEDELIEMVQSNDFDTKVASSRVDTIIRLSDTDNNKRLQYNSPAEQMPSIEINNELLPIAEHTDIADSDILSLSEPEPTPNADSIPMEIVEPIQDSYSVDNSETNLTENSTYPEAGISLAAEEIQENDPDEIIEQELNTEGGNEKPSFVSPLVDNIDYEKEELRAKRKLRIRRTIQIIGVIIAVVALIFIIKFVMHHWQTILIIVAILAVLAILFAWFKRKR